MAGIRTGWVFGLAAAALLGVALAGGGPVRAEEEGSTVLFQDPPSPQEFLEAIGARPHVATRGLAGNSGPRTRALVFPMQAAPAAPAPAPSVSPVAAPAVAPPPQPRPPRRPRQAVAFPLTFPVNSTDLTTQSRRYIDSVAGAMKLAPELSLRISGHTDASGSVGSNRSLSLHRAERVRDYLIAQHAIAPTRMDVVGEGADRPLTPADRYNPANRRVEFSFDRPQTLR